MESDNGRIHFVQDLDNSPLKQKAEESEKVLKDIGKSAEEAGRVSDEAFRKMSESATASVRKMSDSIQTSQNAAKNAVKGAVSASEKELARLKEAFKHGYDADGSVSDMKKNIQIQNNLLKKLENQYKQTKTVIDSLPSYSTDRTNLEKDLAKQKRVIDEEKQALAGLKQKYDELSSDTFTSLRTQIMNITNQMAKMRLEGQQNTEEYKNLEKELGKLASVQREIQKGKLFDSTSGTQIQGIMQGVQALMGAYTAFNGIASIFVEDEQQLMKIQTRLQSTMSILMGLNSVATALHHTSALRLRTLAALQNMWTAATRATTVAMSNLKKAMVSTGIGALVAGVGWLISKLTELNKRSKEARERMNDLKKAHAETAGEVAKQVSQLNAYTNALNKGNLSKREEWDIIKKLNSQYGNLFGKYYTKAEWLKKLTERTKEYTEALVAQKTAEQAASRIVENTAKRDEVEQKIEEYQNKSPQYLAKVSEAKAEKAKADPNNKQTRKEAEDIASMLGISLEEALNIAIETYNKNAEAILKQAEASVKGKEYKKLIKERDRLQRLIDEDTKTLNDSTIKGLKTTGLGGDAQEYAKQAEDLAKARQDGWNKVYNAEIAAMVEGYTRSKAQLEEQHRQTLQQIDREEKDLDKKLKEQGQGGLSDDDRNRFEGLRNAETEKYLNEKKQLEEQHQKELQALYKQTSEAFMTDQQNEINAIKEKYAEMRNQLDKQKEGGSISSELHVALMGNVDKSEATEMANYWIEVYGNYDQKRRALDEQWRANLKNVPPEFAGEAQRQMTEALAKLDFEQFKKTIDWSGIFGDLGKQTNQALEYNLNQIQAYFDANKLNLGIDEIKDIQEAIKSMTDELEGRNPFAGLLNSLKGLSAAKAEAVSAMDEIRQAEDELNAARAEERLAEQEFLEYSAMVEAADDPEAMEAKIEAEERLAAAKSAVAAAEAKKATADQKGVKASNSMAAATKKFTSNLQNTKGVISGVANDAKNLATVFSDDVADGIGKAIDLFDTVIDSATNVIDNIANTGKQVGESITGTVEASSQAMQATSTAAATSISTMEKASVILTVISAALQVATAIASLFGNGDDKRQKEIEALQGRIDQLQWELDNAAIVRLQGGDGADSVVKEIEQKYVEAADEVGKAWQDTVGSYLNDNKVIWSVKDFEKGLKNATDAFNAEKVKIVSKELVKDFANIDYAADKALGKKKWDQASDNAQKYAEQMLLMEEQLNEEKGKKKKDNDKIEEYEQGIAELKQKINDEFNGVVEDILGATYEDIAQQLGDAFFEAFESGADAAEAWGKAVDNIIADVIKKMMIQMFLEEQVASRIADFKKKVIKDGQVDETAILDAAKEMGEGLKSDYENFSKVIEALPDDIKAYFEGGAREASEKGIASMSQDSADEMNGRLTAIQSHTYMINENVKLIVSISNSILISVIDIRENTEKIYTYLSGMASETRQLRASVESMQVRGIQLK